VMWTSWTNGWLGGEIHHFCYMPKIKGDPFLNLHLNIAGLHSRRCRWMQPPAGNIYTFMGIIYIIIYIVYQQISQVATLSEQCLFPIAP
jgi:hypothetical protein